jgi:hypothetical protein
MNVTKLGTLNVLPVQLATSTVTGDAVDIQGYIKNRQLKAVASALWTAAGDSDETLAITMEESDTTVASDFAAITGAAFTAFDDSAAAFAEMHFRTDKRYIRAVATLAGTTPSFTFGVAVIADKIVA